MSVSAGMVSPVFIGRHEEMASLAALLARAETGTPAFGLIGGEAGVGKTRLVSEVADRASRARFTVLTGQCIELGAEGLPLAPLVDALRTLARGMRAEELSGVLGPAAAGLARLLPELAPPAAPAPSPALAPSQALAPSSAGDMQAPQLLELVLGLLNRLSTRQPVMFVIEDLHWADQSTLDLTAFLVRSLRGARVLLMATYRSDELHRRHPLRPLLTSWERVRPADRIELRRIEMRRFDRGEVSAQLAAILGTEPAPDVADVIFDRSGGNAYLVEELADVVRGDGDPADLPPSLRDVLLSRVDTLSENTRRLLRTASVAGRTVQDRLLADVAGIGETELFASLREAVENHLLLVDARGDGYAFRHALTRDAIYDDILPGERVRLHAAYGAALSAGRVLARDDGTLPAALAHHWYAALDLPRALPAAIDAARHAMASYAPAEALRHLERALEIWPRVDDAARRTGIDQVELSRLAAEAAYRTGAVDKAVSLLTDAVAMTAGPADPVRRALLLEQLSQAQRDSGHGAGAAASLEQALALLPDGETSRAHATVLAALARSLLRSNAADRAAEVAARALAAAEAASARDLEADVAITLGSVRSYLGLAEAGIPPLKYGVRLALELDLPPIALRGYINLSDVLELLGRHEEAAEQAAAGMELAERAGLARSMGAYLAGNQAEPLLRLGRWDEADRLIEEALHTVPEGVFAATLLYLRAELAVVLGRYQEALSRLRDGRRMLGESADVQFVLPMRYVEAMSALGRGDLAAARDAVASGLSGGMISWAGRYAWPVLWLGMRAEADEAVRARDRHEEVPSASARSRAALGDIAAELPVEAPSSRGYQVLVTAELARADEAGEVEAWSAAVVAWEQAGEPYPLAYALLRLAEAHAAAGARQPAARAAGRAHTIAGRIGAAPIAAEVAALARRARLSLGESAPPEGPPDGPGEEPADELARFGLTSREREVLLLLAAGRSNPEIAQALFISAKTASVHVSNIMAKLGVSGRVEAAAVAHRLGRLP